MMQFPITRLKSMQSRLDKLMGLQASVFRRLLSIYVAFGFEGSVL